MQRVAAFLTGLLVVAAPAASDDFDFLAFGPYRQDIPTPAEFLGYEAGELHTHHFRMEDYFTALAEAAPERIELHPYGESYEKKQLFYAVVTSEANLARLAEIRAANRRLADPRSTSAEEAEAIAATQPVIVWLDYGNDGNETANVEAAMHVAYQLVAGESEETRRLRDQAVVVIEPDHNPESHDRHVAWYNAFGIGDPDPLAMEHDAPWGMSTNNNHYQIDLNRDAWPMTQRETQALAAQVLDWRPQVFTDHHGQTENYFFAPPVEPINANLPETHRKWYEAFGRGNARAFDAYGWQYYARDVFDLFYPGYWDSWPSLHGAIGMTYETDAGGSLGKAYRKRDGHIATFRGGIAKHYVASLATVRTAVENRAGLLQDFYRFFASGLENGRRGRPHRAYVLDASRDPRKSAALVGTLLRHGIEVERATKPFVATARRLDGDSTSRTEFAAGSYLVDMAQPDQRAAETFLSPQAPLDAGFVERQYEKWSRNARRGTAAHKEYYEFYDITAWSLPVAFGVDGWALAEMPVVAAEPVIATPGALASSGDWQDEVPFPVPDLAAGVTENVATLGTEPGTLRARSAYLFAPEREGALRLAAGLLAEGFRVSVSLEPLTVGERDFPRGTFVLAVGRNGADLHQRLDALARQDGVEVFASDTAFPLHGQKGVGSNSVVPLSAPRIVVVADEPVRTTQYGAAWFTLERRLGYPFTPMRISGLAEADLSEIDVLVIPQGSPSTYSHLLGDDGTERIGQWIHAGGTLVAWGSGALDLVSRADWADVAYSGPEHDSSKTAKAERIEAIDELTGGETPVPAVVSPSARPDEPQPIPGSVARTRLDPTHWMTLGIGRAELPVLVRGRRFLKLSEHGESPVVFADTKNLEVSGFFWPDNSAKWLSGTAYVVVEPVGSGQVILFSQDPNFRLAWRATSRLFANALIMGPSLGIRGPGRY